ncbi:ThiF family adenylyltransferase [Lactococcus petauri]|uniref:ThiF family adenylyltransferase n=1 Tax=Lactococcus petauri TaxID=1940789 RepID=UPI0022E2D37D|nr:ThiF family adenylyltransferase [Lactococcus petauri]
MDIQDILKDYFGSEITEKDYSNQKVYLCNYKNYSLKIVFDSDFPKKIPEFFIEDYSESDNYYTHIDSKGKICYIAEDNLVWDTHNLEGLVRECSEKTLDVINSWDTPQMDKELREEFLSYWIGVCGNSSSFKARSYVDDFTKFSKLKASIQKSSLYLFNESSDLKDKIAPSSEEAIETYFLPLRKQNQVLPPNPKKKLDSAVIKKIINGNLSSSVRKSFRQWSRNKKKNFILIISIPIAKENIVLIGAMFKYSKASLPLDGKNKDICSVTPLLVERFDKNYQVNRTSQDFSLTDKKVAVIGVGSVGSFVSSTLSKMGIAKLFMIDPDYLDIDNISRHYLGVDSLKSSVQKVDAMEDRLILENPMFDIETEGIKFESLILANPAAFDDYDFIIACTGDTMTNFEINHFFKNKGKPVLYSWLDPYGVGYHNLLIQPQFEGCYMCLNYEDGALVSNRLSFAAPDQKFEKKLASCDSSFVPYNAIAPSQLANKTVELFLRYVNGEYKDGNVFSSHFGISTHFEREGFRYSKRYEACRKNPNNLSSILQNNNSCPECKGEYNAY